MFREIKLLSRANVLMIHNNKETVQIKSRPKKASQSMNITVVE